MADLPKKRGRPRINLERNCQNCGNWLLERKSLYDDGSEIVTYKAPEGKGNCQVLKLDTAPDFGCNSFKAGAHIETSHKSGAPWQYWHFDVCPTCNGFGNQGGYESIPCRRCCGTGHVRYYDDGFIGDERTQLHPNDEKKPQPPGPEITLQKIENKAEGAL